jgi:DNA polymerase-1
MNNIAALIQQRLKREKDKTSALSQKKNRPFIFVDGFNVFLRSFLVNQDITNKSEPCGGITGFLRSLDYLIDTYIPERVFVVWETGGGSARRKSMFKEYKSNRAKLNEMTSIQRSDTFKDTLKNDQENRVQQLTTLSALLKATPICQVFVKDVECDDIIAYLVKTKYRNDDRKKIIVSNDKDFYQLLDRDDVVIHDPATKNLVTREKVKEKHGIDPYHFCMAKAIVGDDSDNIPGIEGAGFKTVAKRFPEFMNPEIEIDSKRLVEMATSKKNEIKKPPRIFQDIVDQVDIINRNWDLMYLDVSSLSASQINKIDYSVETHEPVLDKLGFIKGLMQQGITLSMNIDSFCSNMSNYMCIKQSNSV